ncbi:hypothetical protein CRUP_023872, partial [Coryphaenoides rupestris]
ASMKQHDSHGGLARSHFSPLGLRMFLLLLLLLLGRAADGFWTTAAMMELVLVFLPPHRVVSFISILIIVTERLFLHVDEGLRARCHLPREGGANAERLGAVELRQPVRGGEGRDTVLQPAVRHLGVVAGAAGEPVVLVELGPACSLLLLLLLPFLLLLGRHLVQTAAELCDRLAIALSPSGRPSPFPLFLFFVVGVVSCLVLFTVSSTGAGVLVVVVAGGGGVGVFQRCRGSCGGRDPWRSSCFHLSRSPSEARTPSTALSSDRTRRDSSRPRRWSSRSSGVSGSHQDPPPPLRPSESESESDT